MLLNMKRPTEKPITEASLYAQLPFLRTIFGEGEILYQGWAVKFYKNGGVSWRRSDSSTS